MKNLKNYLSFILIISLSYFAIKPLFVPSFFTMHDDTQVARVYEMGKALRDDMFPVRWVSELGYGYGYPIFNFYAPLSYYIGGAFNILNFDALTSTKLMIGFGILISGIFMYLLASEFWGKIGGIISAIFYIYAPYHALDIYVRGDVAELYAYAFIPLVFYGLFKAYKEQKWKWVIIGSLGYAGIILSHNLTAMMVTPFIIIAILLYCYIAYKNKKTSTIYYLLFTIVLGLLLSSFYWLPAILEMQYTNVLSQIGGGADFKDHFVCLPQLWDSLWGFGGSVSGCIDGMSFKIGKLHVILSLTALLFLVFIRLFRRVFHYNDIYHYSDKKGIVFLSLLGLSISILLTLEISKPIWEMIPFMAFVQYPWRFLLLASFFSSFLAGFLILLIPMRARYLVGGVLILSILYSNAKLFQPQTFLSKTARDYVSDSELKWRISKISDEYMPKSFNKPSSHMQILNGVFLEDKSIKINELSKKTQEITVMVSSPQITNATLAVAPFPAWRIDVDGKESKIINTNKGIRFFLPKGNHIIKARFEQTQIEKIANILSIIGVLALFLGIIKKKEYISE